MNKITGIILLILGIICIAIGGNKVFNIIDEKGKETVIPLPSDYIDKCSLALENKKYKDIIVEFNNKKITIKVLDCVEEMSNSEEKIYLSSNKKYQLKVKMWQADIQTLNNIIRYNYSIQENYPSYYLIGELFKASNGVEYNIFQAYQVNDEDEIVLRNHVIIYPIDEENSLSMEFTYVLDELTIDNFKEIANYIEIKNS